jgi:hypothetical protein
VRKRPTTYAQWLNRTDERLVAAFDANDAAVD